MLIITIFIKFTIFTSSIRREDQKIVEDIYIFIFSKAKRYYKTLQYKNKEKILFEKICVVNEFVHYYRDNFSIRNLMIEILNLSLSSIKKTNNRDQRREIVRIVIVKQLNRCFETLRQKKIIKISSQRDWEQILSNDLIVFFFASTNLSLQNIKEINKLKRLEFSKLFILYKILIEKCVFFYSTRKG